MAEGIARESYSDLASFASAGTHAVTGAAPTEAARIAASEIGVDISGLRASHIPAHPVPDLIYVMTEHHRSQVAHELPDLVDRVELLNPFGHSIADPYGMDLEVYRATRNEIAEAIDQRAFEWARAN